MITEWLRKIKRWIGEAQQELFLASIVFLAGLLSFGLGRLSAEWPDGGGIVIESAETGPIAGPSASDPAVRGQAAVGAAIDTGMAGGAYVASQSGAAYHLPHCPGAKQIKAENRVWFQTKAEAERAGYRPAANCPGL
ncbi:hypothetical protein C4552_00815 [Candidatus Parcubacteria bacterium]|nr:MAG: hypothetical protein C4552_00815 [Candidatus Parcubacteria bacterium]